MKKQLLFLVAAVMLSWSATAQMVLQFDTEKSDGTTVTLPLYGTVNVTVDWGDGQSDTYTAAALYDHTYAVEGSYTVEISGNITQFGNGYTLTPNIDMLVAVTSFGDIGLTSLHGAFFSAKNLIQVPDDLPATVTTLEAMFYGCKSFNHDIGSWDVSEVTIMSQMFRGASSFNQNIGNWNVSKVEKMTFMFLEASLFNQDIGLWDVSNVTNMNSMFRATAFNQNIGNWNVSKVTTLSGMFLEVSAFNQNIGNWNVSNVTNMSSMFYKATSFNQNIGGWDVSKVTNMGSMFSGATAFNQNIGLWNVGNVTSMSDMFRYVTLSTANYDSLLIGWSAQTVQNGVVFSGGNSKYSLGAAAAARAVLTGATNGWTITDGGEEPTSAITNVTLIDGVYTQAGKIVVENDQNLPISIYDVTGRLVTSGSSIVNEFTVPNAGVYIVTVGTQTMKVVVP